MAEPNITLLGATYSGVKGVTLPKQGGGSATFPWVEGSQTTTSNGTIDVTNLAELIVNVSGGGGSGLVYESGTYTPTEDIARPTISFTKSHTTLPIMVMMSDTSAQSTLTNNSNLLWMIANPYTAFGQGYPYSSSAWRYALVSYAYKTTSNPTYNGLQISNSSSSSSSNANLGYYVATNGFYPLSNNNSRYWKANHTYKWIAVWSA